MSTTTILACRNESLRLSLNPGSLHSRKHGSSAPRSTSDPTSRTKTSSLLCSPSKSWEQSYSSFQTSTQAQCPHVHYHPWCNNCQTLMEWEPPLPISAKRKQSMLTFGDLKTVVRERSRCQSHSGNRGTALSQSTIQKVCSTWREEQFARAIVKRSAKLAAWEALPRAVHWQHVARGAAPPVT